MLTLFLLNLLEKCSSFATCCIVSVPCLTQFLNCSLKTSWNCSVEHILCLRKDGNANKEPKTWNSISLIIFVIAVFMCISESHVQPVSTQQWPRWCFQQKGFMNTQWHRNLCLVISKRRLVQIDFKLFTVHYDIRTESYQWPMAASSTHYASKPLFHMKTQDFWDITPYRLVVTTASKDLNAPSSGSSSLTSDFFDGLT
jgi:hypothetical protein